MIKIKVSDYARNVIARCAVTALPAIAISLMFKAFLPNSVPFAALVCCLSAATVAAFAYYIGLTRHEREVIGSRVAGIISRFKNDKHQGQNRLLWLLGLRPDVSEAMYKA